jgi:hypothetical protein
VGPLSRNPPPVGAKMVADEIGSLYELIKSGKRSYLD